MQGPWHTVDCSTRTACKIHAAYLVAAEHVDQHHAAGQGNDARRLLQAEQDVACDQSHNCRLSAALQRAVTCCVRRWVTWHSVWRCIPGKRGLEAKLQRSGRPSLWTVLPNAQYLQWRSHELIPLCHCPVYSENNLFEEAGACCI
jgi:hypothetical protein